MKYIKTYEFYNQDPINNLMGNNKSFRVQDVMDYLGVEVQYPEDSVVIPQSIYDIDVIEYFKEIFIGKKISFKSVNKPLNNPRIDGIIEDVSQLAYQDEFFIKVKGELEMKLPVAGDLNKTYNTILNDDYHLMDNLNYVNVYDYDADTKPLHKEVEMKREAMKYNL